MKTRYYSALLLVIALPGAFAQEMNFVACPVVRDTKTVPCFLAEYKGETYFLAVQQDITAELYPPQLLHEVLVEGTVAAGPRVCGGIPLKPIKLSVMPELNRACNTILPAEPGIDAPPTKRPAGPSTRQAPVSTSTPPPEKPKPPFLEKQFSVWFDFDSNFLMFRNTRLLADAAEYARVAQAKKVLVTGHRGAVLLSDGNKLTEKDSIADLRTAQVADLLKGFGVGSAQVDAQASATIETADGKDDWKHRVVVIQVIP